jgi:uncharacterized repeat protein (TIGR03803 family)
MFYFNPHKTPFTSFDISSHDFRPRKSNIAKPLFGLFLLIFGTFCYPSTAFSQKLYWTSSYGGTYSNGAIIEYDLISEQIATKYSLPGNPLIGSDIFLNTDSWEHPGALMKASDGFYYGVSSLSSIGSTANGWNGAYKNDAHGVLFKINPQTYEISILHVFEGNREFIGHRPSGSFNATTAYQTGLSSPIYAPIEQGAGILYGLANDGGQYGKGGIYKYDLNQSTFTVVASFNPSVHGENVYSPLTKGDNTNLYGVLQTWGTNNSGYLYKLDYSNNQLSFEKDLEDASEGILWVINHPYGQLVYDGFLNKLFGVKDRFTATSNWGGGCYAYDINTGALENRFTITFNDLGVLGSKPQGIIRGNNGKFYIVTTDGGANNNGTIIEYDYSANVPNKVHDFPAYGGQYSFPSGEGLQLIGSTIYGFYEISGSDNSYTMWSYDYVNGSFNSLLLSDESNIGVAIQTSFIADNNKFIGRSVMGGTGDVGSIFEYDLATHQTNVLKANFSPSGRTLIGELTTYQDSLLLIVNKGGADSLYYNESGGFMKLDLASNNTSFLESKSIQSRDIFSQVFYTNAIDSTTNMSYYISNDQSSFVGVKNFFGMDLSTGQVTRYKDLPIFQTNITGAIIVEDTVYFAHSDSIYAFSITDTTFKTTYIGDKSITGQANGKLILASDGKLYGTTANFSHAGAQIQLFSYDPTSSQISLLHAFDSTIRALNSELVEWNGKLYGSCNYGGNQQAGYLFSYDLASNSINVEHDFEPVTDGQIFEGPWTVYNDELYAVSYGGGASGNGTLVRYTPTTSTFTKLKDLTIENGRPFKANALYWEDSVQVSVAPLPSHSKQTNSFYPNPATNNIYVTNGLNANVLIYSISGKLVLSEKNVSQCAVGHLPKGSYLVQIQNEKRTRQELLIIE